MQENTRTKLTALAEVISRRHHGTTAGKAGLSLSVVLKDDPASKDEEDERLAARMCICQVALYVDVALVGNTIEQVWPHLYGFQHARQHAAQ